MRRTRELLFGEREESKIDIWGNTTLTPEDVFISETPLPIQPNIEARETTIQRTLKNAHNSVENRQLESSENNARRTEKEDAEEKEEEEENRNTTDFHDPLLNPLVSGINSPQIYSSIQSAEPQPEIKAPDTTYTKSTTPRSFEAFIVVGAPVYKEVTTRLVTTSIEPQILFEYPKRNGLPLHKITGFCFPDGIRAKRLAKKSTELNELFYGQQYLHNASSSFTFLLTGNENRPLYGMCVCKDEALEEQLEFLDPSNISALHTLDSKYVTIAPRVYCIISQYPFYSMHYDIIYGVIAHEKLLRMSRQSLHVTQTEILINHDEVLEILENYYESLPPAPGETFFLPMPYEHKDISFYNPPEHSKFITTARWCFVPMFRTLSLSSILHILAAVLQETQIVFVSRNLGILSSIVLGIVSMIRPLEWQGLLVPILPQHLKETLNAPVPYICGVVELTSPQVKQLVNNRAMIVHLDVDAIRLPPNLPELPEKHKLQQKLKGHHKFILQSEYAVDNPYFTNQEFSPISESIYKAFYSYCSWLVNNISKNFGALGPNEFTKREQVKTQFLGRVSAANLQFVKVFLDSQTFNTFLENYLQTKYQTES